MKHIKIVIDWDDTLLCSSELDKRGFGLQHRLPAEPSSPSSKEFESKLRSLDSSALTFLEAALYAGPICGGEEVRSSLLIITNAESGWVTCTAQFFLPRVYQFLIANKKRVRVVSARTNCEQSFPDNPVRWKCKTFQQLLEGESTETTQILSIGDSLVERQAARMLQSALPQTLVKSVKLVERPTIDQMHRQLNLMKESLPWLIQEPRPLDLEMVVT